MSYAIAEVIYGKPITNREFYQILDEVKVEELGLKFVGELLGVSSLEDVTIESVVDALRLSKDRYFETRCSGRTDAVAFLGVSLCEFNEGDHTKLRDLQLSPTAEQYIAAFEKLQSFPEVLHKYFGPLETYIFWSTS